tara:strand:- start:146 stop:769 length:624 start_codon:yes stop_codon:yes gene_type:complete
MKLTPQLAELIGMHVGDGSLYKTNTGLVWELRGDLKEKDYYEKHIVPLINNLFNINLISKFRNGGKNGVWGIQTCNKQVISTLFNFKFKPGTKTYTVKVPEYIFNSNVKIKRAFIRGLFDTDGCLNFMRINNKKEKDYPRIKFSFASKYLIDSLKLLLEEVGFKSYAWNHKKEYSLCLAGKEKLLKWEKEIKPKNPKFLKKVNEWRN